MIPLRLLGKFIKIGVVFVPNSTLRSLKRGEIELIKDVTHLIEDTRPVSGELRSRDRNLLRRFYEVKSPLSVLINEVMMTIVTMDVHQSFTVLTKSIDHPF